MEHYVKLPTTKSTADYPDLNFHLVFLQLFAYYPPYQDVKESDIDIHDLSFHVMYAAGGDAQTYDRSSEFLERVRALIEDLVEALNRIRDPAERLAEGNRLAKEVGARQAAAEEAYFEIIESRIKTETGWRSCGSGLVKSRGLPSSPCWKKVRGVGS